MSDEQLEQLEKERDMRVVIACAVMLGMNERMPDAKPATKAIKAAELTEILLDLYYGPSRRVKDLSREAVDRIASEQWREQERCPHGSLPIQCTECARPPFNIQFQTADGAIKFDWFEPYLRIECREEIRSLNTDQAASLMQFLEANLCPRRNET